MRTTTPARARAILDLVFDERQSQEARYGETSQKLEDGTGPEVRWLGPYTGDSAFEIQEKLRGDYEDYEEETGAPTWVHLVREEVAEAFLEVDPARLAEELIQVAALCVSWVERLELVATCEECGNDDGPHRVGGRRLCLDCAETTLPSRLPGEE